MFAAHCAVKKIYFTEFVITDAGKILTVGVHIRLGDYDSHIKRLFNYDAIDIDYFNRAFKFFIMRHQNRVRLNQFNLC